MDNKQEKKAEIIDFLNARTRRKGSAPALTVTGDDNTVIHISKLVNTIVYHLAPDHDVARRDQAHTQQLDDINRDWPSLAVNEQAWRDTLKKRLDANDDLIDVVRRARPRRCAIV